MKMRKHIKTLVIVMLAIAASPSAAQQVNDNNTPLHLMKPANHQRYGIPTVEEVKQTMDRVLKYIDSETPAVLIDKNTGKEVMRPQDINADTQLKQGGFRLTSYEWGVTYSGVLAAWEATGDKAYKDYVYKRQLLLAKIAPRFKELYKKKANIDNNIRRVIDPHALDDAGAVCTSMIKALLKDNQLPLRELIDNYSNSILNKEYRMEAGTFA